MGAGFAVNVMTIYMHAYQIMGIFLVHDSRIHVDSESLIVSCDIHLLQPSVEV